MPAPPYPAPPINLSLGDVLRTCIVFRNFVRGGGDFFISNGPVNNVNIVGVGTLHVGTTFNIKSRSPKSNHFFLYVNAVYVQIWSNSAQKLRQ